MPQLHATNHAAYLAQAVTTIPAQLLHMLPHMHRPAVVTGGDASATAAAAAGTRSGGGAAGGGAPVAASVPLSPMLCRLRDELRHFCKLAKDTDGRAERREHGLATQYDDDGDAVLTQSDGGGRAAAAPAASQRSQRTQRDGDGDVIMGIGALAAASSDTGFGSGDDSDGPDVVFDSGGDPVLRDGRRARDCRRALGRARAAHGHVAPSPFGDDFGPPRPLKDVIPTPILEWATHGPATLDGLISASVRVVASSPQNPLTEELLRGAGKAGYLDRVVDLPGVDLDAPAGRRGCGGVRGDGGSGGDDGGGCDGGDDPKPRKVQRVLTALVVERQWCGLAADLQSSGDVGRAALAQLHSQRGPGAMAWLQCPPGRISAYAAALMVLLSIGVWDPWRVEGDLCPFCGDCASGGVGGPTALHALGCAKQHERGRYATHTAVRNGMLRMLRRHKCRWHTVEDASPFLVPDRRMDIVVAPQGMALACDAEYGLKGILIDHTVRCPTMPTYVRQAAQKAGWLAGQAEQQKRAHYGGTFDAGRFVLVPFVQETFGRMGKGAVAFVRMLASHSAASLGGSERVVATRAGLFQRFIVEELSLSLARELPERVSAYVRGAAMMGRRVRPVSALFALSPTSAAAA
jgi:hypothetical protein